MDKLERILLQVSETPEIDTGALEQAQALILQRLQDGLVTERVSLWFYEAAGTVMQCQIMLVEGEWHREATELTATQFPRYFQAMSRARTLAVADARHDERTSEFTDSYLVPNQIFSMLDVPVRYQGRVIGIICCEQLHFVRHWTAPEIRFAGALADLIGRAINANRWSRTQAQLELANQQLDARAMRSEHQAAQAHQQILQAQEQLLAQTKFATLGSLVAGITHEVATPLGVAFTATTHQKQLLEQLSQALDDKTLTLAQARHQLQQLRESQHLVQVNLQRAERLMQQFKDTAAHQTRSDATAVALRQLVIDLIASLSPMTSPLNVSLEVHIDPDLVVISSADIWLQILTNFISNSCLHAFDAVKNPQVQIYASLDSHHVLTFVYQDNGVGLSNEVQQRLFEPFFTTKAGNGGTGLGMSIVRQLVEKRLEGTLAIGSNPGFFARIECLA